MSRQAMSPVVGTVPLAHDPDLNELTPIELDADKPTVGISQLVPPAFSNLPASASSEAHPSKIQPTSKDSAPTVTPAILGSGAASAPARARSADLVEAESAASAPTTAAPPFTFGGVSADSQPTGSGSKKILIRVAALLLITAGIYVAWTRFDGRANAPSVSPKPYPPQVDQRSTVQPAAPPAAASAQIPTTSASSHTASEPSAVATANNNQQSLQKSLAPTPKGSDSDSPAERSESAAKAAAQPIVVKNRSAVSSQRKSTTSDAPAPSIIGIASAGSGGALSELIPSEVNSPKPVLQTVNISQGVSQGLLTRKVQPTYPPTALRMKVEGSVQLLATIGKTGNITAVKVLSGEPILAKAALDAVKQWKYKPYYLNGDPVEIQTQVTINFKLPR
jgi:protein TonB